MSAAETKYHSSDFDKTPPTFRVVMPEKLSHKQVEKGEVAAQFSAERKHPVHVVDLPSNVISMTIGGIEPGGRTNRHRHTYETVFYVLEGRGYSMFEDVRVEWEAGDACYIPVWAWHHHVNLDPDKPAKYIACESAPLLQNIGGLAIREEPA